MLRELHRWADDGDRAPIAPAAATSALDRAAGARVALVAGPPGTGGAETVRGWLAARPELRSAWLRFEASDAAEPASGLCARIWDELSAELDPGTAQPTVLVLEGVDRLEHARSRVLVSAVACLPAGWRVVAVADRWAGATPAADLPFPSLRPAHLAVDRRTGHRLLVGAGPGEVPAPLVDAVHRTARGWRAVWRAAAALLAAGADPAALAGAWRADLPELLGAGEHYLAHVDPARLHTLEDQAILGGPCGACTAGAAQLTDDLAELAAAVDAPEPHAAHPVVLAAARARAAGGSWALRHLHLLADRPALETAAAALEPSPPASGAGSTGGLDAGAVGILLAVAGRVDAAATTAAHLHAGDAPGLSDLVLAATAATSDDAAALAAAVHLSVSAEHAWGALRHLGVPSPQAVHRLAQELAAVATERLAGRLGDGTPSVTDALRRAGVGARRSAVSPA